MTCIAITRAGRGKAFRFDTLIEADEHPLIQYGDAFLSGPEDVSKNYNWNGIRDLKEVLEDFDTPEALLNDLQHKDDIPGVAERIWDVLVNAPQPPSDPEVILNMVREDRAITRSNHMADDKKKTTAAENKDASKGGTAEPKPKRSGSYDDAATITFGKDKEGNAYGPKNNPKREGSKSHERFAAYKSGMTVRQALDAGVLGADLKYDEGKEFIVITPPKG
jgi:hypothetical protein